MIEVQLVTTWNAACGISEHAAMLKDAVKAADPTITISPCPEYLDPSNLQRQNLPDPPLILHLNYQAGLHSRWTPDEVRAAQKCGYMVVITYHDTYDGTDSPNSDQAKALCAIADAFIVHEPVTDLPRAIYWRQGVPGAEMPMALLPSDKAWKNQPLVGSLGFPFPWKNFDLLCEASALAGWAVLLIASGATDEDVARWRSLNPHLYVRQDFVGRREAISFLTGCDATAFLYVNHNTGTSGAIRMGLAARKPVLAIAPECGGRQFRDLEREWIHWIDDGTPRGVATMLESVAIERCDPHIVALAHRDSWTERGRDYTALYHRLREGA